MRTIQSLAEIPDFSPTVVLVDASSKYADQLQFKASDQAALLTRYRDYLSKYGLLHDTFMTDRFLDLLDTDGYEVYLLPDGQPVLDKIRSWAEPLEIKGLDLPSIGDKPGGLFPYQQFGIRKALDFYEGTPNSTFFFNHATGTGKSVLAAGLVQEMLVNRKEFDYVFIFTLKKNKKNFCRDINEFTEANALVNEGTAEKRTKWYAKPEYNVFVMNYEKAHFDSVALRNLIRRKRVLFIFDEIQKILSYPGDRKNRARKGLDLLAKSSSKQFFVPTSATVVNGNPLRYWRVFDFGKPNPLGLAAEFKHKYATEVRFWNYVKYDTKLEWNQNLLSEVRHVVSSQTHSVRKTDPGVKELFKSTKFIPVRVEMSDEDRALYDIIDTMKKSAIAEAMKLGRTDIEYVSGPFVQAQKLLCTTAEALKYTENIVGQALVEAGAELSSKTSAKFEAILDKIESIVDQGDKVVVFTHWANLTLKPFSDALKAKGINHVNHHGSMSDRHAQDAQDAFKRDPAVSVFLSSDAGSHGLNFPEAKYVINIEIPLSYDDLTQRNDRVDRVNSWHEGITMYGFIMEDTVEENGYETNKKRMKIASVVQGTTETLGRPS